ncbi:hypothetical protein EG68_07845 [Paragonimus skrjabini miyazakii]|uniref:Uncharacterized protein n=1 Tax=Paragonimus skrjabini miyazakii TaxID=59628 RepID=A0A8S9Y8C2_9TREM|nr:hypothetical protein EG68_07845 [Paragonimus skrjabini miyazakii]
MVVFTSSSAVQSIGFRASFKLAGSSSRSGGSTKLTPNLIKLLILLVAVSVIQEIRTICRSCSNDIQVSAPRMAT